MFKESIVKPKLETREDFAKSHLRVAKNCFQQAKDLIDKGTEDNVLDLLDQAMENLIFAEDFGMRGKEMDEFKKEVYHYRDKCKKKIENKNVTN